MNRLRIGCVPYLNAAPLVHFLEAERGEEFEIVRLIPSQLAPMLDAGEVQVALMPVFDYLSGHGDCLVPDISISSIGAAGSVILFAGRPLAELRAVHYDIASRSSSALLRILMHERWGCNPEAVLLPADPAQPPRGAEGALLIGDAALRARGRHADAAEYDLGTEWHALTGLPFVFAAWTLGAGAEVSRLTEALRWSKCRGLAALHTIAAEYAHQAGLSSQEALDYFTVNMNYDLAEEHLAGVDAFADACVWLGLVTTRRPVRLAAV